ncbi:MAG: amino acid ABC transporter permease [Syntrophomonadaceae bacterium]|jgi:L-cystine transport system permease protein|nr:amino acid ABC transporter permease [Syntrophomonadaceae bacterium]
MDFAYMTKAFPKLFYALPLTLGITFAAMIAGMIIGGIFTVCKLSRWRILSAGVHGFTVVLRGIPTIVLLFLSYFGLPVLFSLFGININNWTKITFAIIALTLEVAAVASELFRSAWLSLDKGQLDAATSIGMNRFQITRRVIVPQGLRVIVPNIGNLLIGQFQNTSLVYTLGIIDIIGRLNILNSQAYGAKSLELYISAAILYWLVCVLFSFCFHFLEQRLNRGIMLVR